MTREEFLTESQSWDWYELMSFCEEMDCMLCKDIYGEDERDEYIDDYLEDIVRTDNWRDVRDFLNNLSDDYEFYERDDYGGWHALDDGDLITRIRDVIEWMDGRDLWDEEGEEEEDEEDATPIEDEDISISELLVACNKGLKSIREKQAAEK